MSHITVSYQDNDKSKPPHHPVYKSPSALQHRGIASSVLLVALWPSAFLLQTLRTIGISIDNRYQVSCL